MARFPAAPEMHRTNKMHGLNEMLESNKMLGLNKIIEPKMIGKVMACALALVGLVSGQLAGSAEAQSIEALYEAAKKEGKVIYWSPNDADAIRVMSRDFQKQFPGIQIEHFEIQPGPSAQRMIAEAQAGKVNLDVFDTPIAFLQPIMDRDLVQPYDWASAGVKPNLVFYDNKCVDYYHLDVAVAYNTNMVKDGQIDSWDDLLDPKWKGKVVVEARGLGLAILKQNWGQDKTGQYIDALKANGALILKGGTPTAEALASGQAAIAIGTYSGKMEQYKGMGAPVNWAKISPIPAMNYVLCVPRKAAHPNAARLFTQWLTTKEGQESLWSGQRFGRIKGEILSPVGKALKEADAEVVLETQDTKFSQAYLSWVAKRIGGL